MWEMIQIMIEGQVPSFV